MGSYLLLQSVNSFLGLLLTVFFTAAARRFASKSSRESKRLAAIDGTEWSKQDHNQLPVSLSGDQEELPGFSSLK